MAGTVQAPHPQEGHDVPDQILREAVKVPRQLPPCSRRRRLVLLSSIAAAIIETKNRMLSNQQCKNGVLNIRSRADGQGGCSNIGHGAKYSLVLSGSPLT